MAIETPPIPFKFHRQIEVSKNPNSANSMSQDFHQLGIFNYLNGFEPPPPPPAPAPAPEEIPGALPAYETAGMLSEMFNYPPEWQGMGGLGLGNSKNQSSSEIGYHRPRHPHHQQISSINVDSAAAAMQLFHMNPQPRSPPSPNPPGGSFGQFTWVPDTVHGGGATSSTGDQVGGVVEGQGLSLSLSSPLFFNQGGGGHNGNTSSYVYKNFGGGSAGPNHHHQQVHVGFGSSLGAVNVLRNSKYVKAAQELLEEFCSVGRCQFKKNRFGRQNPNPAAAAGGGGGSSSSSKDLPPLSAADRVEHQRRKVKLMSMLDEVDRRYNHYCEQMQMVVNSFDLVLGFGSAVPYTTLAQKAMSRHFRCLKDAIAAQLRNSCELLGDKDAGTSGVTKGETPRLRMLELSLRQQRAFRQMGMMEQEAWRPQRGLPERSVNILRAWLFEHFLHPYPSDADKHLLARQTGLSRNQVSNWFINARVRLWKPMVEDMYQQESKEEAEDREDTSGHAQTSTPTPTTANSTTTAPVTTGKKKSEINSLDNDPSLLAINRLTFSENQAKQANMYTSSSSSTPVAVTTPAIATFPADVGSTIIRFGTASGDVSLTLGLRHAGNLQSEKNPFSFRDFGAC